MNGDRGSRCQSVYRVTENVQAVYRVPCLLWDERLSTVCAQETVYKLSKKKKSIRPLVIIWRLVISYKAH